eukprot:113389-Rhodomonas_salina.2
MRTAPGGHCRGAAGHLPPRQPRTPVWERAEQAAGRRVWRIARFEPRAAAAHGVGADRRAQVEAGLLLDARRGRPDHRLSWLRVAGEARGVKEGVVVGFCTHTQARCFARACKIKAKVTVVRWCISEDKVSVC